MKPAKQAASETFSFALLLIAITLFQVFSCGDSLEIPTTSSRGLSDGGLGVGEAAIRSTSRLLNIPVSVSMQSGNKETDWQL